MRDIHVPNALKAVYAKVLAYQPEAGEAYYAFSDGDVSAGKESKIVVTLWSATDQPVTDVIVTQEWTDGNESFASDEEGHVTFHLGTGSRFKPPRGGPHRVYVGLPDTLCGDVVYSLGSPDGQPITYHLTFRAAIG